MSIPPEHPVREILEQHIIPYVVSARKLTWQPFYILYNFHVYTRDILAGLIGVGISSPVMGFFSNASNGNKPGGGGGSGGVDLQSLIGKIPLPWLVVVALAAILIVSLRVYVNQSKAAERAILLRNCANDMRSASLSLNSILDNTNPMNDLLAMRNKMTTIANSHIGTWPWDYEPAPGIEKDVAERVERLCQRFGGKWTATASVQQIPAPQSAPLPSPAVQPA